MFTCQHVYLYNFIQIQFKIILSKWKEYIFRLSKVGEILRPFGILLTSC